MTDNIIKIVFFHICFVFAIVSGATLSKLRKYKICLKDIEV